MLEKEFDKNMTKEDLDNLEEAIHEFTRSWQKLMNVCMDTNGDCNEIISETLGLKIPMMSWQTIGSLDDVFHDGFQVWLKACNQNILSYRDHLAQKITKLIRITRPAWIKETYKVSFVGDSLPEEGEEIDPSVIRQYLEDENTIQLETEISCHMDSSNAIGAEIHEDEFAEITLDEIEEVE
jgi:hypothetical protein